MKFNNESPNHAVESHELLELAILDVEGYLEPDEREAFERAFASASPAIQAQVRREQTRWAMSKPDLPAVDAPAHLRAKILALFRQDRLVRATGGRSADVVATLRPAQGVNRLWRIGAVAAAAAAIALGFNLVALSNNYDDIASTVASNSAIDEIRVSWGPGFDRILLGQETQIVQLRPVSEASDANRARPSGLFLVDSKGKAARLLIQGLDGQGDSYDLIMRDERGNVVRTVTTFRSSPTQFDVKSLTGVSLEGVATIALQRVGDAAPLLVGTVVRA